MANSRKRRDDFEDVSSYSSKAAYNRNIKKKRRTGLKVFLSILCTLLVLVGGALVFVSTYLLGDLTTQSITRDKEELGISSNTLTSNEVTNIALFGIDSRAADGTFSGRSDAIMVLSIDRVHNKIKLTSIMRDIRLYMGDLSPYSSGYDKLNHAYMYGGAEGAIRVINQNYGLDIADYVTVDFSGMAKIVDAFGGVDLEITDGEIDEINKNLQSLYRQNPNAFSGEMVLYTGSSGMAHLDGNQAVAYGRIRNIGDDNERVERQQKVLSALLSNATSLSVLEYPNLIRELAPLCETSITFDRMISLAQFALGGFTIERLSIPSDEEGYDYGYYEGGGWMWTYDVDAAGDHIRRFIYEEDYEDTTSGSYTG